jgi:hypothetical protein
VALGAGDPALRGGSNGTQPMPSNQISGQACKLRPNTLYDPWARSVPGVRPTATRGGIPSVRAIVGRWLADFLLDRRR